MKTGKRIIAIVLCVMFVVSSFPLGVISFGGNSKNGDSTAIYIGYYNGMTLDELVEDINQAAGLDKNVPAEEWSWYTSGVAEYEYGRYLIDVKYDTYDYENINVIRGIEIYKQYLNGEITKQELEEKYSEVDMMFNDINIDVNKLEATVEDALDSANRKFRKNRKYVSFKGETNEVKNLMIELDPDTDPHCAYDVSIDLGLGAVEQTLHFPTRLELNGTESYPSVLYAAQNGQTITAKHGDDVYTINVYGIARSEVVLTGKEGYVYPISYNVAAGDVEKNILDRIYQTVVDFENSTLAEDFDINLKNGFTVRYYDKLTGWYEFGDENTGRVEAGNIYDVELIYEGDTTETVEFQIALFDPRVNPSIAIYGDDKLVVDYTDNVDDIKKAVFEALIDKSDLPEDVSYLDFDYYYAFGGFANKTDLIPDEKFEQFRDEFYDQTWETVKANLGDHPIFEKIGEKEFKEKYFTKQKLEELLREKHWIDFDGGYCPITVEIEDSTIELFQINMPAVFAAMNHEIKVVYRGNGEYTSAETESTGKVLQITAVASDLDVLDGCYLAGSDVKGNLLSQRYSFDSFMVTFEIDTEYLEIVNIYVDFPSAVDSLLNVRFSNGKEANISEYIKKFLARENFKLKDLIKFLDQLENSEFSTGSLGKAIDAVERLLDKLPESAYNAPINYNGLPANKEGTYFVAAITADINAISNKLDYGICFVVPELERDYYIIYSNEIPEEGFEEYPDFDFSAFVFDENFEPYEENPIADSIFIGYSKGSEKIIITYDIPTLTGQYIQISKSSVANPVFRYFDIGLNKVIIESPGDVFEFDGLPHGQPIIHDYFGNEIALDSSDTVIYTNIATGNSTQTPPYKVGSYNVTVIFSGREEYNPTTASYSFKIVPKEVDVWVEDATMTYGDPLPKFTLGCSDSELLDSIEYTVVPNVSYHGNVGVYGLVISIKSMPEGYSANKLGGKLTVIPRSVTIEMNDISMVYGSDYQPDDDGLYNVIDGSIIEGDSLGLVFEKFSNAGVYPFSPLGYTNQNYQLTVVDGTITIEKRKITLTIKDEFIYVGDELPQFVTKEECPEDLKLHIAPSYYYTGEVGEYLLIGYTDNPNYDVTIYEGTLFVNPKPPVKVTVITPDYNITYGDELPEFEVITSQELKDVEFIVNVAGEYNGDVGTYPLSILATGQGQSNYSFEFVPGKLTVDKKDVTVKIEDYTGVYGDKFDPKAEYTVSCDDEKVDLSKITFEIGAEGFDGQVGSYLFIGKGVSRNYNVTVETGILVIDPKLVTVVPVEGQGKTEGDVDSEIEYLVNGLVGNDSLDGLLSRLPGEEVGLYEILLGSLNNPNYKLEIEKVMYAIRSKDYRFIRIDNMPDNTVFLQGAELDLSGIRITAITADGSEVTLNEGEYQIFGFDGDTVGQQRLTVYYKGHMTYFEVVVTPTEILNIKIDKLPSKLIYIEGQEFDPAGMTVVVFYDNGTHMYIDAESVNFSGYDMFEKGKQTITAEYGGKTESFEITVITKDVSGIELDTSEVKTEYVEGNPFTYDGLKVYLVYNNGTKILLSGDYVVEGYSADKLGVQNIEVTYGDLKAEYQVNVIEKKVTDLQVKYDGEELFAVVGNPFNSKQLEVIATFNDGSTKVLSYGEYTLEGYNANSIGIWSGKIAYGGLSVDVLVRVVAFSIERVEITKLPDRIVFELGEENVVDGIEVTVYYNNGTSEVVTDFDVYGFNSEVLGMQKVTVSHLGYKTEYVVTIVPVGFDSIEITTLPDKIEYIENTEVDFSGIEVYMICGDNKISIDFEDLEFSSCDMTKVGSQTVTVSYAGKQASFEIYVAAKQVVSISPVSDKALICILGSAPQTNGVYLLVEYDNGESERIEMTAEMLGEYDNSVTGKRSVEVVYNLAKTEVAVWFVVDEVTEILIATLPSTIYFSENMEFTAKDIEVLIKYANGSFDVVHEEDCEFFGYDMSTIGEQTVTVRYANESATYSIIVSNKQLSHLLIDKMPEKLIYVSGEELDLSGISVQAYYDNGEFFPIGIEGLTVTGFNTEVEGEQTICISSHGLTAEFTVTVIPVAPVGIELDTSNVRLNYYIHNVLMTEGLKVYLNYNNGDSISVSVDDCEFEGYDPFTEGEQVITVKYNGYSAEFVVTVALDTPLRIEIDASAMNVETTVGTSHAFDKMIVRALYSDGTYSNLVYGAYTVENYDYTVHGIYNATVIYRELSESIVLTVLPEFTLEYATGGKAPIYLATENGLVIDNLGITTTVAQLKSQLAGGEYLVVTDAQGNVLTDNQLVATGSVISFVHNDVTYGRHNVIVKGDVNGDGILNVTDAVIVIHAVSDIEQYPLDELALIAADVSENNGFNITDVVVIKHTIAK